MTVGSPLYKDLKKALKTAMAEYLAIGEPIKSKLTDEEINLGRQYNKIEAIKAVRSRGSLGLKESKDLVESEFQRLGYTFGNTNRYTY